MNYLLFPCIYGITGYLSGKKTTCILTKSGKIKLCEKKQKNNLKIYKYFGFRGIHYLFSGFFYTLEGLYEFEDIYDEKKSKILKKAEGSLNISAKTILYFFVFLIALLASMFIFGFVPLKISWYILNKNNSLLLKKVVICTLKIFALIVIFGIVKILPLFSQYLKFNGAIINSEKSKINYFKFFVCSSFVSTIALSFFGLVANVWYFFIVNFVIAIVCFCITFELLLLEDKCKPIKYLFLPLVFLIYKKPSQNEIKCVNIVINEISFNSTKRDKEKMEEKNIPFSEAYICAKDILQKANKFEQSDLDFIFCEILNKNRAEIKLVKSITKDDYKKIIQATNRRKDGEPISKIFNHTNFYGLDFYVNKDVLSPRLETEILVEEVLKNLDKNKTVLDIGTGSGVIAVCLAKLSKAKVTALDIDDKALAVAKQNAKNNNVKIEFLKSDIFSAIKNKKYNIIVSNPPYILSSDIDALDKEVKNFDPLVALDGGDDGLCFYKKIIEKAPDHLLKNGKIFFEVGKGQAKDVKKLLQKNFKDIKIVKDYNKIERVVYAEIIKK